MKSKTEVLKHLNKAESKLTTSQPKGGALPEVKSAISLVRAEPQDAPPIIDPTAPYIPQGFVLDRSDPCTDSELQNFWGLGPPFNMVSLSDSVMDPTGWEGGPARICTAHKTDIVAGQSGTRCELGNNYWQGGLASQSNHGGTGYLYKDGDHRVTIFRRELPWNYPLNDGHFQTLGQIKQTQPCLENMAIIQALTPKNVRGGPALEVQCRGGHWMLINFWFTLWETPAYLTTPTIILLETVHSPDPSIGMVKMVVLAKGHEPVVSPPFFCPTLSTQVADDSMHGLLKGEPHHAHFRGGIYHDASMSDQLMVVGPTDFLRPSSQ